MSVVLGVPAPPRGARDDAGVALLLVIFIVALASFLALQSASSAYVSGRAREGDVQRLKAEYLLKSALNLVRTLEAAVPSNPSPPQPGVSWAPFVQGVALPPEALGLEDPGVEVSLEVRPEDSKLPLAAMQNAAQGTVPQAIGWARRLRDLFVNLGFDQDDEPERAGPFKGRTFRPDEMVVNLVDYMDSDRDDGQVSGLTAGGVESGLPEGTFADAVPRRIDELARIPGFTPARMRALSPFVSVQNFQEINANAAPAEVLRAVGGTAVSPQIIEEFVATVTGPAGPYNSSTFQGTPLSNAFGGSTSSLKFTSEHLQVIARVRFGDARYFLKAVLDVNDAGTSPFAPGVVYKDFYG